MYASAAATTPSGDEPKAKPRKRVKDKSAAKRSLSSPGDDRLPLDAAAPPHPGVLKTFTSESDGTRTETIVMTTKREFKVERVEEVPSAEKIEAQPVGASDNQAVDVKDEKVVEAVETPSDLAKIEEEPKKDEVDEEKKEKEVKEKGPSMLTEWRWFMSDAWSQWKTFKAENPRQYALLRSQGNRCFAALLLIVIYCGAGGLLFRFTEGAFEAFYKCGVKRVKRNFVDDLWVASHHLREEDWKSQARKKLMDFEEQLHAAHEAGVTSYSGQRAWSFLNAVVYCLTVVTTIGYGHLSPSTTTGRAVTIVYAIFGIPLFLILLADFGKLFTRGIKFLWAFVRRLYYTGSCRKVRRTAGVQEVMKGVQLVYDFAKFRRPSQVPPGEGMGEECDVQAPLNQQPLSQAQAQMQAQMQAQPQVQPDVQAQGQSLPLDGREPPSTPAPSAFEVDDEFNLPISIAITILLTYIFVGAAVYYMWEEWGFFESFYFVFISMSTIGFGDFVPKHPMYMMASIVYLVFGLALTSMCINVVQEKLSDHFRQASAKIGATIGLRIAEEDGTVTPGATQQTDDAEAPPTMIKSAST